MPEDEGAEPFRHVFAVLTRDSVYVYDTYHVAPLSVMKGLHYAGLTDVAWTGDGRGLLVSSSDGYVSLIGFEEGELGEIIREDVDKAAAAAAPLPQVHTAPIVQPL